MSCVNPSHLSVSIFVRKPAFLKTKLCREYTYSCGGWSLVVCGDN